MESVSLSPADRLRMLETNSNLLRERISLLSQNLVDSHRSQHQHVRQFEEQLKELKATTSEIKLTLNHLIQELNQFAKKDQLRVIEKYLNFWNPLTFITQKELDAAIAAANAAKSPAKKQLQRQQSTENPQKSIQQNIQQKRGVHHRTNNKTKAPAE